ncbi:hypothetical protein HEB29_001963 [Streptomyces fulvorobeus]|uniref:Uncharacterized protein n=1 Tax=Streptomyces fulvorobeus TaxID=284028 RepID=A0A7Y9HAJ4_9ACTN|nr:hypothetical protein [Streptomyces fulvorobeus]
MSQKLGAVSGSASRTEARTRCSRARSWASIRARTFSSSVRTRSAAPASSRASTASRRPASASRASEWMPSAGWFASSFPASASIWMIRPRGRKVW